MTNQVNNPKDKRIYDLAERTGKFGESIVKFCQSLTDTPVNRPLINQLVRAGTSIGANYMEADVAESKKDFQHKIGISRKEAKETLHWLNMIAVANPSQGEQCGILFKEAHELVLIFSAILGKSKLS